MGITRREWLKTAGAAIVAGLLPNLTACGDEASGLPRYDWTGPLGPESTFELGVASGDALADAIVLWTHVSPGFDVGPVDIWVEVAVDPGFARRVVARSVPVDQSTDYALKVDVDGLEAGRTYYYRPLATRSCARRLLPGNASTSTDTGRGIASTAATRTSRRHIGNTAGSWSGTTTN